MSKICHRLPIFGQLFFFISCKKSITGPWPMVSVTLRAGNAKNFTSIEESLKWCNNWLTTLIQARNIKDVITDTGMEMKRRPVMLVTKATVVWWVAGDSCQFTNMCFWSIEWTEQWKFIDRIWCIKYSCSLRFCKNKQVSIFNHFKVPVSFMSSLMAFSDKGCYKRIHCSPFLSFLAKYKIFE